MPELNQKAQENSLSRNWRQRLFVTLRTEQGHEEVDLEMPGDQPVGVWMPDLVKILNWPSIDSEQTIHYRLRTFSGKILSDHETLSDAGVENSDVLWISLIDPEPISEISASPSDELRPEKLGDAPEDDLRISLEDQQHAERRGTLSPPTEAQLSITEPSLVSTSGRIFVLGSSPILVGRKSRGHQPDIDLSELDEEYTASRRHATILRDGDQWVILARETTNGTFVNGVKLSPDEKRILDEGDIIQFGFEGVKLMFCSGAAGSIPASFFRPRNP